MPETALLEIPELALVLLVGITGSEIASFTSQHFLPAEVVSSDFCQGLICDEETHPLVNSEAFQLVYAIAEQRLKLGHLTVIDATHMPSDARQNALKLAKAQNVQIVAIVLPHEHQQMTRTVKQLKREGIRQIHVFNSPEEFDAVKIERKPLCTNKKEQQGPFDIIGDVHGCCDELEALLLKLGYTQEKKLLYRPPPGRKAFFVGDLIDRGPRNLDALTVAMNMVQADYAMMVPGNHEAKFVHYLEGKKVQVKHGLEKTVAEFEALLREHSESEQESLKQGLITFLEGLVSHCVLDQGKLVVAHAGMLAKYQGRDSGTVRAFALYGETTGEIDSFGLPVRLDWAAEYRAQALVVYGHVPVPEAEFVHNTIDIDTGCVFGGKLTALRYPELVLVQEIAQKTYYAPIKPLV